VSLGQALRVPALPEREWPGLLAALFHSWLVALQALSLWWVCWMPA